MVKNEKGFTLIELIVVIVVLGILAAFAYSRYTTAVRDARISAVNGVAGGLRSAVALVQGQYLITGTNPVTMYDTTTVAVGTVGAAAGVPTGAVAGIGNAMRQDLSVAGSGWTVAYVAGGISTFRPTPPNLATCQAAYTDTNGNVTTATGGC
ncbi:MAG: prepilin-type N-terminal cleavage/methylation domain-containing protein [Nitrospirae bacterium]|nr:prepilin-type N-terminal cleavage/methylation domain-containing protein [Nitrospirota bacterium]